ncbi:hypothetical protein CSW08_11230 [Confluentibacter flavum]|uniref:Uncharacterized protein n=1 Tax=Confluentibacter flavum TaxID=1909700 RepID=A0A2N3HIT8_9FLAO|nr:hypothetical protein CSW08_11230 [Confluentibacter flavum]
MGIKHRTDKGFRKFRFLRKLCLGVQACCSEMPYVSKPRTLNEPQNPLKIPIKKSQQLAGFKFIQ